MRVFVLVLWVLTFICGIPMRGSFCQTKAEETARMKPVLPVVFQLGEFDKQYEAVIPGYQPLLDACKGDMRTAYDKLMSMMQEMEAFSYSVGYDLKGINVWMHFFWGENGQIEHIGFYLKPNSRNVDTEGLKQFLAKFARQYKFPLQSNIKFSLYSSFSFPIVHQQNKNQNTDKSTVRNTNKSSY